MFNITKPNLIKYLYISILLLFCRNSFAQDGTADLSFGSNGKTIVNIPGYTAAVSNSVQDMLGNIYVTGNFSRTSNTANKKGIYVAKFNYYGFLDITFGDNGLFIDSSNNNLYINDIQVNNVSDIFLAGAVTGSNNFPIIIKLNMAGIPDQTFGNKGVMEYTQLARHTLVRLSLKPTGDIVAASSFLDVNSSLDIAIVQIGADGQLQRVANNKAAQILSLPGSFQLLSDMSIQNDGKILLCGRHYTRYDQSIGFVARFNADGSLDNNFGNNGMSFVLAPNSTGYCAILDMCLDAHGNIFLAGYSIKDETGEAKSYTNHYLITKLNSQGKLDTFFGIQGQTQMDVYAGNEFATSIYVQPDDQIIVGGNVFDPDLGGKNYVCLYKLDQLGKSVIGFGYGSYVFDDISGTLDQSAITVDGTHSGNLLMTGICTTPENSKNSFFVSKYISTYALNWDQKKLPEIWIYPIPANKELNVKGVNCKKLELFDAQGKSVKAVWNANTMQIDDIPSGNYFLQVAEKNSIQVKKVKIQH